MVHDATPRIVLATSTRGPTSGTLVRREDTAQSSLWDWIKSSCRSKPEDSEEDLDFASGSDDKVRAVLPSGVSMGRLFVETRVRTVSTLMLISMGKKRSLYLCVLVISSLSLCRLTDSNLAFEEEQRRDRPVNWDSMLARPTTDNKGSEKMALSLYHVSTISRF